MFKFFIRRDALGNWIFFKRILFFVLGIVVRYRFKRLYDTQIKGGEHIVNLPKRNVLFVSNHQTYFADVALIILALFNIKNNVLNRIGSILTLFNPILRIYFIAARETMKSGILPRLFTKGGGILIKRSWREKGKSVRRRVDKEDVEKISKALKDGWVITFPQGTTTPFVKGRKGTAHMIKKNHPIVVPIVIDGFRRAFDKKGLRIKKKGTEIKLTFKEPLIINYDEDDDKIMHQIMYAIEQSEEFHPKV
ncbi:lysophospholipid acyltransferase family protein [Salibacter sp.]|uniref:lysophospholipid acyltransferase family protein n=1 Tax=Salibacter sp. TaxID=2010995 RepID=UPI0028702807|nr:lysophospholipid acyltransferase family protein [Salibacter sp.]MDR9399493.1 lysophospholipid acyltransferase family protein [Salibacter sp.]MDR9488497.1 lysophospholipid acyltransferase family protein [Salibacter sp.]